MAHQTEIVVNGQTVEVTEFDHTAQEIDDGIDNLHTLTGGATTPQGALAALGAGVRPSLVDNGIFVGVNLPVNQRGDTSWSNNGYHIDRWFFEGDLLGSIDAQGLHVAQGQVIYEKVDETIKDFMLGKTVTISILLSDGSFASQTAVIPNTLTSNFQFYTQPKPGFYYYMSLFANGIHQIGKIFNNTGQEVSVVACKTELGTTQTLAYQDDTGAWQLLPQPESDYATQLAKCQRYGMYGVGTRCAGYAMVASTTATIFIPTPVPMRTFPAAEVVTTDNVITSYGGIIPIQSFSPVEIFPNGVLGDLTLADALTSSCNVVTAAFKCNLKADL